MSFRAVVSVKGSKGGSGLSGVARYIAESKRDEQREGKDARPLFNGKENDLTYRAANRLVSPDKDGPEKRDIIHLVVSLEKEDYERLGATEEERLEGFRLVTRETMKEVENTLEVEKLHWFAGIHRNTDNPHVHVAIGRDAVSRENSRVIRIEHLPRVLLPHNERTAEGEKTFVPGTMAEKFIAEMDAVQLRVQENLRQQERGEKAQTRDEQKKEKTPERAAENDRRNGKDGRDDGQQHPADYHERYVLGRALVARGEVERLTLALQNAQEHGDKRRFRVWDDSRNRSRWISEFDIRRRADARAMRRVHEQDILDRDERRSWRQELFEQDVSGHDRGITNHRAILGKTIEKTEAELKQAWQVYGGLRHSVTMIRRNYEAAGKELPVPLLTPRELFTLELQAISARKPERLLSLEKIRISLAAERGAAPRTDREAGRLQGQLIVARTDEAARAKRLDDFERSRHQTRWEVDGEKWSLSDLDRETKELGARAIVFSRPGDLIPRRILSPVGESLRIIKTLGKTTNILPSGRRRAAAEVERLTEVRAQVERNIVERRETLQAEHSQAAKMTSTLEQLWDREAASRGARGQGVPAPVMSNSELNRLEANAQLTGDPQMLRLFQTLEAEQIGRMSLEKQPTPEQVAGRALAREIVAEVTAFESEIKLHEFEERMEFSPVVFADAQGRDRTGSLYEFREPRHLTEYIAERVLESKENREFRLAVEAGVGAQHEQIKSEFDRALECLHVAKGAADGFRADYERRGQEPPAPVFTRKEINQLELFAERQTDREIFRHYDQIITGAERDMRVIEAQQENRARIEMQEQPRDERGVLERSAGGTRGATPQTHDAPGGPPDHTIDHQVTRGDDFSIMH